MPAIQKKKLSFARVVGIAPASTTRKTIPEETVAGPKETVAIPKKTVAVPATVPATNSKPTLKRGRDDAQDDDERVHKKPRALPAINSNPPRRIESKELTELRKTLESVTRMINLRQAEVDEYAAGSFLPSKLKKMEDSLRARVVTRKDLRRKISQAEESQELAAARRAATIEENKAASAACLAARRNTRLTADTELPTSTEHKAIFGRAIIQPKTRMVAVPAEPSAYEKLAAKKRTPTNAALKATGNVFRSKAVKRTAPTYQKKTQLGLPPASDLRPAGEWEPRKSKVNLVAW